MMTKKKANKFDFFNLLVVLFIAQTMKYKKYVTNL